MLIIVGKQAEGIVDLLEGKKHVNEFIIAKKLDLTINQTRNVLYKISDHGLVSSIRKKDKKKGWYTYFWKIETLKCLEFLKEDVEKRINQLKNQVKNRETKIFYICERCNIEMNEETAMLNEFSCPECGDVFTTKDSEKLLKEMKKQLERLEEKLSEINEEIDKEQSKLDKAKEKIIKKEEKEKAEKRAAKRAEAAKKRAATKKKNAASKKKATKKKTIKKKPAKKKVVKKKKTAKKKTAKKPVVKKKKPNAKKKIIKKKTTKKKAVKKKTTKKKKK
jgi:transcription factor E